MRGTIILDSELDQLADGGKVSYDTPRSETNKWLLKRKEVKAWFCGLILLKMPRTSSPY
jgi:hypothetical protein